MKTRSKIISFFVMLVLCFSAYESQAFGGPRGRGDEGRHLKWVLAKAGVALTEDQQTQIKAIMKDGRDQTQTVRDSLKTARRELRELILTGSAKDSDLQAKIELMTPIINQMALNRALTFSKIVALLTSEQLSALQARSNSIQSQKN